MILHVVYVLIKSLFIIVAYVSVIFIFFSGHYHTMVDSGLVYLCVADQETGKRMPYLFLDEVSLSLKKISFYQFV